MRWEGVMGVRWVEVVGGEVSVMVGMGDVCVVFPLWPGAYDAIV